jgi:pSer/pThr/pTyr-binding forkhead associated (FHA) protein
MLSLNSDLNAGTDITGPRVNVFLKEGLADQKEWIFDRQFSIGRDSNADICIKDATVSRFHAFAHFIGGEWWIRDMNSSNGTFINDKEIFKCQMEQQTKLQLGKDGPILHLCLDNPNSSDSETILVGLRDIEQYNLHHFNIKNKIENDVPDSGGGPAIKGFYGYAKTSWQKLHNYSRKWRKSKPLVACILLAGLILACYVALQEPHRSDQNQNKSNVGHNQANSEDAAKNMQGIHGNGELRAAAQYSSNHPIDLEKEKSNGLQQEMIQNYTTDIFFNAARKFSDHHRWQPALDYYQRVAAINPYHTQLDTEIAKMKFEIGNQATYEQGMAHIKEKRFEQGNALLRQIGENSVYYHEAQQLIVDAEKMRVQAAEEQKKKEAEKLKAAEEQKAVDTMNSALRYYADGDTKSAIGALNQVISGSSQIKADLKHRANTLKKEIFYARSLYRKGDQAYASGKIDTALNTWKKLIKTDQKLLSSRNAYFSKSARQKMANEYGTMAQKAYSEGDFPAAYQYSKLALNQKRNHPQALKIKKVLKAKSKQLYQSGYILEAYDPEKAQEKWKQILQICDSDTEYYKKALVQVSVK